jgi:hypothetical protein
MLLRSINIYMRTYHGGYFAFWVGLFCCRAGGAPQIIWGACRVVVLFVQVL